eukprot:TRINITY_DN15513_c3_g1_i1.p1 TRINITY_DN15513_c3_g1~~TRINITY_DN15513_c3_g1_i1.p1  ORF type:complete len:227 (-),score=45.99 TRINITY_DN15513_c3_g1_i1:49-708(-)
MKDTDALSEKLEQASLDSPLTKEMPQPNGTQNGAECSNGSANQNDLPREDYLEWDEYFMAVSFLSALRSKDPATQVGACIVNPDKRIVGIGYNGMPRGCGDSQLPWGKSSTDELENKYMYVCHAEMNAIMNKNSASVEGCTIYVALFPCNECSKLIIQSGIKEVIYFSDKHAEKKSTIGSKRLLDMAGIKYKQFIPRMPKLTIDFFQADPTVFQSQQKS